MNPDPGGKVDRPLQTKHHGSSAPQLKIQLEEPNQKTDSEKKSSDQAPPGKPVDVTPPVKPQSGQKFNPPHQQQQQGHWIGTFHNGTVYYQQPQFQQPMVQQHQAGYQRHPPNQTVYFPQNHQNFPAQFQPQFKPQGPKQQQQQPSWQGNPPNQPVYWPQNYQNAPGQFQKQFQQQQADYWQRTPQNQRPVHSGTEGSYVPNGNQPAQQVRSGNDMVHQNTPSQNANLQQPPKNQNGQAVEQTALMPSTNGEEVHHEQANGIQKEVVELGFSDVQTVSWTFEESDPSDELGQKTIAVEPMVDENVQEAVSKDVAPESDKAAPESDAIPISVVEQTESSTVEENSEKAPNTAVVGQILDLNVNQQSSENIIDSPQMEQIASLSDAVQSEDDAKNIDFSTTKENTEKTPNTDTVEPITDRNANEHSLEQALDSPQIEQKAPLSDAIPINADEKTDSSPAEENSETTSSTFVKPIMDLNVDKQSSEKILDLPQTEQVVLHPDAIPISASETNSPTFEENSENDSEKKKNVAVIHDTPGETPIEPKKIQNSRQSPVDTAPVVSKKKKKAATHNVSEQKSIKPEKIKDSGKASEITVPIIAKKQEVVTDNPSEKTPIEPEKIQDSRQPSVVTAPVIAKKKEIVTHNGPEKTPIKQKKIQDSRQSSEETATVAKKKKEVVAQNNSKKNPIKPENIKGSRQSFVDTESAPVHKTHVPVQAVDQSIAKKNVTVTQNHSEMIHPIQDDEQEVRSSDVPSDVCAGEEAHNDFVFEFDPEFPSLAETQQIPKPPKHTAMPYSKRTFSNVTSNKTLQPGELERLEIPPKAWKTDSVTHNTSEKRPIESEKIQDSRQSFVDTFPAFANQNDDPVQAAEQSIIKNHVTFAQNHSERIPLIQDDMHQVCELSDVPSEIYTGEASHIAEGFEFDPDFPSLAQAQHIPKIAKHAALSYRKRSFANVTSNRTFQPGELEQLSTPIRIIERQPIATTSSNLAKTTFEGARNFKPKISYPRGFRCRTYTELLYGLCLTTKTNSHQTTSYYLTVSKPEFSRHQYVNPWKREPNAKETFVANKQYPKRNQKLLHGKGNSTTSSYQIEEASGILGVSSNRDSNGYGTQYDSRNQSKMKTVQVENNKSHSDAYERKYENGNKSERDSVEYALEYKLKVENKFVFKTEISEKEIVTSEQKNETSEEKKETSEKKVKRPRRAHKKPKRLDTIAPVPSMKSILCKWNGNVPSYKDGFTIETSYPPLKKIVEKKPSVSTENSMKVESEANNSKKLRKKADTWLESVRKKKHKIDEVYLDHVTAYVECEAKYLQSESLDLDLSFVVEKLNKRNPKDNCTPEMMEPRALKEFLLKRRNTLLGLRKRTEQTTLFIRFYDFLIGNRSPVLDYDIAVYKRACDRSPNLGDGALLAFDGAFFKEMFGYDNRDSKRAISMLQRHQKINQEHAGNQSNRNQEETGRPIVPADHGSSEASVSLNSAVEQLKKFLTSKSASFVPVFCDNQDFLDAVDAVLGIQPPNFYFKKKLFAILKTYSTHINNVRSHFFSWQNTGFPNVSPFERSILKFYEDKVVGNYGFVRESIDVKKYLQYRMQTVLDGVEVQNNFKLRDVYYFFIGVSSDQISMTIQYLASLQKNEAQMRILERMHLSDALSFDSNHVEPDIKCITLDHLQGPLAEQLTMSQKESLLGYLNRQQTLRHSSLNNDGSEDSLDPLEAKLYGNWKNRYDYEIKWTKKQTEQLFSNCSEVFLHITTEASEELGWTKTQSTAYGTAYGFLAANSSSILDYDALYLEEAMKEAMTWSNAMRSCLVKYIELLFGVST